MCGGSPLIMVIGGEAVIMCDGEIHRRGDSIFNSRSPLSETGLYFFIYICFVLFMSGRFTGSSYLVYSRSPLSDFAGWFCN